MKLGMHVDAITMEALVKFHLILTPYGQDEALPWRIFTMFTWWKKRQGKAPSQPYGVEME